MLFLNPMFMFKGGMIARLLSSDADLCPRQENSELQTLNVEEKLFVEWEVLVVWFVFWLHDFIGNK
ncbi:hypothetical protein ASC74_12280 [Pseudomonas sp. Root329]|nr:hypothetical protein ASC74_12280 [Pseudomonas sp. Root329]